MQKHIPESITDPKELELYELARKYDPENFVTICNSLRKGQTTYIRNNKPVRTVEELMNTPIDVIARLRGIGPQRLNSIREMKGMERKHNSLLYLVTVDGHSSSSGCDIYVVGIFRTYERAEEVSNKLEKRFPTSITQVELGKEYDMEPDDIGYNYFNELYLGGHTGL